MYFDYDQYVRGCLIVPVAIAGFALLIFVCGLFAGIREILGRKMQYTDIIKFILLFCVCAFFLTMNVGQLMHGGIYLVHEQENDAIEIAGIIQKIEVLGPFQMPSLPSDYSEGKTPGVLLTVDGIQCTAVVKGHFEIGDVVIIKYLPKSGYVLAISEAN